MLSTGERLCVLKLLPLYFLEFVFLEVALNLQWFGTSTNRVLFTVPKYEPERNRSTPRKPGLVS